MSKEINWNEVFAHHPNAKEIYVVGAQPFLEEKHARNYAASSGQKVETVTRDTKAKADKAPATSAPK